MALFSITRYSTDPERHDNDAKDQNIQNDILQRLHKAAAERKRKSLSTDNKDEEQNLDEELCQTPAKRQSTESPKVKSSKKKRRKDREGADISPATKKIAINATDTVFVSPASRKKRKLTEPETDTDKQPDDNKISKTPKKSKHQKIEAKCKDETKHKTKASDSSAEVARVAGNTVSVNDNKFSTDSETDDSNDKISEISIEDANKEDSSEDEQKSEFDITGQSHQEVGGFTVIGDVRQHKADKVERMLPHWLARPSVITDDIRNSCTPLDDIAGLHPDIMAKLKANGIKDFFPVQSQLLPVLLKSTRHGLMFSDTGYRPSDICCSAPTGSGKTLSYVLPIVQCLRQRVVPQVRALVVLPVRDLVTQVFKVFSTYCAGTELKVGQIIGKRTFANEQQMLVRRGPRGYHSNIDILVTTPGRLVDHINTTTGFTLKHLRFLVIDEADRMMDEIKQDWLSCVERAVHSDVPNLVDGKDDTKAFGEITRLPQGSITAHSMSTLTIPLQKLLFSATLSQNPEKLQTLNLFQPKLYTAVVGDSQSGGAQGSNNEGKKKGEFIGKYTTPSGLTEYYTASTPGEKPLAMIHFIQHLKFRHILCFTNSVEATHRLYWILKLTCNIEVREFSSNLKTDHRNKLLKQFADGKIDVLVCSDAMARGIDIENVQYVISYEMAPYLKTYIHRAGRTARAGKAGTAISLLNTSEIFHFKKMLKEAGKSGVKELKVKVTDLKPYISDYQEALKELQHILEGESNPR